MYFKEVFDTIESKHVLIKSIDGIDLHLNDIGYNVYHITLSGTRNRKLLGTFDTITDAHIFAMKKYRGMTGMNPSLRPHIVSKHDIYNTIPIVGNPFGYIIIYGNGHFESYTL